MFSSFYNVNVFCERPRILKRKGRIKHVFEAVHSHFFLKSKGLKDFQPDSVKCLMKPHEHLIQNTVQWMVPQKNHRVNCSGF